MISRVSCKEFQTNLLIVSKIKQMITACGKKINENTFQLIIKIGEKSLLNHLSLAKGKLVFVKLLKN